MKPPRWTGEGPWTRTDGKTVEFKPNGKTHQNVLVFCKGDAKKATAAINNETK